MLSLKSNRPVRFGDGLSRREFLRVSGLSVGLGLAPLAGLKAGSAAREAACIQIMLVGGPSHLETWDPKPDAPAEIRGPFQAIRTTVPGLLFSEHLPRMAASAHRFAVLRSIHHHEAPIHEIGFELLQTGGTFQADFDRPHFGAMVSKCTDPSRGVPPWVVTPRPIGDTGVPIGHSQSSGFLGPEFGPLCAAADCASLRLFETTKSSQLPPTRLKPRSALMEALEGAQRGVENRNGGTHPTREVLPSPSEGPVILLNSRTRAAFNLDAEPPSMRARYGWNPFGQSCLLARRLVEHGVRVVTVNMFDTVFHRVTWDCHANGSDLPSTLEDYRRVLCPMLDQAFCALLDDLSDRGLLGHTVVVCMGEFGRTPKLNSRGGRDHWPGVWSGIVAGGPIQGGRVIGASDPLAREPKERPIHPCEIVATVYHVLGIDPAAIVPGPDGKPIRLVEAAPIWELF